MSRDTPWTRPDTVRGFVHSPPNATLLRFAAQERARYQHAPHALDIGCGAARNATPLVEAGWDVCGVDTSWPMLAAARDRITAVSGGKLRLAQAAMTHLPFARDQFDLVIAHGVWNLATSDDVLRRAIADAARVARHRAALFVFTFSRHTLPADATPTQGATYIYDGFSGQPQAFLTAEQILDELGAVGFLPDAAVPLTEHNRPSGPLLVSTVPVIFEGAFRKRA